MATEPDVSFRDQKEDARNFDSMNTSVGAAIGEMARTTLGPTGMDKMFVDSNGTVLITNSAKTLLGEMNINLDLLPAAKLLKEVAVEQDNTIGDGTTTAVIIAGELLERAGELFEQGLHPTTVAQGYHQAAQRANDVIADAATEVSIDDTARLEATVQAAIAGRGGAQDEEQLASLIVEAADILAATDDLRWNQLEVKKISGGTAGDNTLTRGIVIEGDPVHGGMPRFLKPAKVVCLNTNLTVQEVNGSSDSLKIDDPDHIDRLLEHEHEQLTSKVNSIVESGADVVFSDKSIDERAQQLLADQDLLALRRIASSDLTAIANATGSTVTDPNIIGSEDLGYADRIEYQPLGNENVFSIITENSDVITLVLRGGTQQVLNEVERAVRSGFAAAEALHQDERVVPGGGAVEIQAARVIREYANSVESREQLAVEAFSDALEAIPRSLAENAGFDPIDALLELRYQHDQGRTTVGVQALERTLDDVAAAGILDPLRIKQRSVTTAVEVVTQIIRIDDVLEAEPVTEIET